MAVVKPVDRRRLRESKIRELKNLVLSKFPDARFQVAPAPDMRRTTGVWVYTTAEWEEVRDLVDDLEFFAMLDHDIHILTMPQPLEAWEG